jgi:hypothetical protein
MRRTCSRWPTHRSPYRPARATCSSQHATSCSSQHATCTMWPTTRTPGFKGGKFKF